MKDKINFMIHPLAIFIFNKDYDYRSWIKIKCTWFSVLFCKKIDYYLLPKENYLLKKTMIDPENKFLFYF